MQSKGKIYYAGIGSRKTPQPALHVMVRLASRLASDGYILRSGGAKGADTAFEMGCAIAYLESRKAIYRQSEATEAAIALASRFHPNWSACGEIAQRLHGRNAMIILGPNLDQPVKFVCCWTPGGKVVGGTGLALRIAEANNIPIRNLADCEVWFSVQSYLAKSQLTATH